MTATRYGEFLVFAVILILIPGADFAVVTKNTLTGGRARGRWTALGICSGNVVQGTLAATGMSAIILRVEPVFEAIKWAGVAYLVYLGVQAIRSAVRGEYALLNDAAEDDHKRAMAGWRQGFLSNMTNPKVLVFYLAVLPQFLAPGASFGWVLLYAWSHAALGIAYLFVLIACLHALRRTLQRRKVRQILDAATGTALLGFSARLAADHL
jgi:threonine/homoserine/homoserine lactone efflux protein